jgi:hypothetical protein
MAENRYRVFNTLGQQIYFIREGESEFKIGVGA